jgi:hypothetical protein
METAQVICRLNNGLKLTLGAPWFNGHPLDLIDREPLALRPGLNILNSKDATYWRAWAKDHSDSEVIASRFVYET